MQLTKQNSLLVPVVLEGVQAELPLGDVRLCAKKEHHLTVFGFGTGKVLRRVLQADASLGGRINEVAAAFDWAVTLLPRFYHLSKTKPEGGTLQTVIVRVDARVAAFFEEVRGMLGPRPLEGEASRELDVILTAPPPPHITLYTTDPEGLAGIGLNTEAELEEAVTRGQGGDASGLAAFLLGPGVVPVAALRSPR